MAISSILAYVIFTRNVESGIASSVKATLEIDKSEVIICPSRAGTSLYKGIPNTDTLAVRLEFQEFPHAGVILKL